MLDFPICFKRQYDDKLEMYINSFKDNYNILCYYMQGSDVVNEIDITSANFTLEGLNSAGIYNFY